MGAMCVKITKVAADSTDMGLRIRNRRIDIRKSQKDVATECGLKSKSTVCMWERGIRSPSSDNMARLANALNTTIDYLVAGEGAPT